METSGPSAPSTTPPSASTAVSAAAAQDSPATVGQDLAYHLVAHGHYSADGGAVVDDESYSEVGSATENHAAESDPATTSYHVVDDGTTVENWSLSWAGTVSDGALVFTSFNYTGSWQTTAHQRSYD